MKSALFSAIKHTINSTIQLVLLLPEPYVGQPIQGSNRNIDQLLAHLAQIPQEELLLMQGKSKEEIKRELKQSVVSAVEFQQLMTQGIHALEEFAAEKETVLNLRNADGISFSLFEWCLEVLMHLCHHRAQVLAHLNVSKIHVPKDILKNLFRGHL